MGAVTSNIDSTIRSIKLSNNLERIKNFRAIYKDSEVVQDFFKIDGVENGVESTLEEYKTQHEQKWAEFEEKGVLEIKDQLAITSHMPNFCNVSKPNDETLKQVISRAEEIGCKIAICHNHPSGNINEWYGPLYW